MDLRRYGVATTVFFPLIDKGATDLESTPVTIASGDCKISKDGGAFANTTTASFSHVAGGIYSIPLTATEMQARVIVLKIVDQTGTKEWEDQVIVLTTCNHASAEVPSFWASVQDIVASAITASSIASDAITAAKIASDAISAAKIATGAITAAKFAAGAIDAAAIATDAIDADALKADAVTEIQSGLATASALSTVAGYLDTEIAAILAAVDTEIAAIKLSTDNLPSDPADASVIAGLIGGLDTKLDTVTAKTNNLPSDPADASVVAGLIAASEAKVDLVKAKTDLIPAAPAAVGDIPTAIQNADALLKRDLDNVEASAPIHSLASAMLKLVSRFVASTGRTYRTDGTTIHMTQTPTTDAAADPITELGTAS